MVAGSWQGSKQNKGEIGIWGGPGEARADSLSQSGISGGAVMGYGMISSEFQPEDGNQSSNSLLSDGAIVANTNPFGSSATDGKLLIYIVQSGDTVGKIAERLGLTPETILAANPGMKKSKALHAGQELKVPPVSGVVYTLKDGETAASVAANYKVPLAKLREFNRSVDMASPGVTIIIPGATPAPTITAADDEASAYPNLKNYFRRPTTGFNWGKLHKHNAVDIANVCGTEIDAAAEGIVIESSADGWNGGYGSFVQLEHPNGTKTKYAHLSALTVTTGDYLDAGQKIGAMGQTGEATGCHLHFEVEGAQNPLAK